MLVALYDSNKLLIDRLKGSEWEIVPFTYEKKDAVYTAHDVSSYVNSIKDRLPILFLINLEAEFSGRLRTDISGLYFYQCLIKEYGSSQNFNYLFYSFLSLSQLLKIHSFAFIIKPEKHKQLPFDITGCLNQS